MQARSMVFTAHAGQAEELAALLVQVAESLRQVEGCVSWIVARNPSAGNEVWVQELWRSAAEADRAQAEAGSESQPSPADVMALCAAPPRRTDLVPVGGVGFVDPS